MSSASDRGLDDCGGCGGVAVATPLSVFNRPGLSAIAYRLGTHADFLASMQAGLTSVARPILGGLNTRDTDDFTIALLDCWAVVADVLTFYQERIANEGYLRTATERLSVLELARLIGYELRPGVAAGTMLAFTLEAAPGSPPLVTLTPPIKVTSVPGPGEKPQTYETIEAIDARVAWNALTPRLTEPQTIGMNSKEVWLAGTANDLTAGDALLIVGAERVGDAGSERWDFRRIKTVEPDTANKRTRVTWEEGLGWRRFGRSRWVFPAAVAQEVHVFRQKAALFGGTAPDWRIMPNLLKNDYLGITPETATPPAYEDWPGFSISAVSRPSPGLRGQYFDAKDLTTEKFDRIDTTVNFTWGVGSPRPIMGVDTFSVRWTGFVTAPAGGLYTFYVTHDDGARLWIDGQLVIDSWIDTPPLESASAAIRLERNKSYAVKLEYYENGGNAQVSFSWSGPRIAKTIVPAEVLSPPDAADVHLDARYPTIVPRSWVVLSTPQYEEVYSVTAVAEDARKDFTLQGKTTRLTISGENLKEKFDDKLRETTVYGQNERLTLTERPIDGWTGTGTRPASWYVEGDKIVLASLLADAMAPGRRLIVTGYDANTSAQATESATLLEAVQQGTVTALRLTAPLTGRYHSETVTIRANVAAASHGETVSAEVLGSGDASLAHQRFALRQGPLTYTAAANEMGAATTLKVDVGDVTWKEVSTLHERSAKERVYVSRTDDAAKTTVQFGDGLQGARLPTGRDNVVATYRKGIGKEGEVRADQLSLLMTRPLGLKGVTNPVPGAGAQDPQALEDARSNAPPTVITLGRVVSLTDYEDYARSFAGIGKASASWVWTGDARGVLLTAAGIDGAALVPGGSTDTALRAAIRKAADPTVPLFIVSYRSATFTVDADLLCDADRDPEKVQAAAVAALTSRFSFAARAFGQSVTLGEVVAVLQNVPGVVMVDVNSIARAPLIPLPPGWPTDNLPAETPRPGDSVSGLTPTEIAARAAELLTIALPVSDGAVRVTVKS